MRERREMGKIREMGSNVGAGLEDNLTV